jgi:hypothetical protein
MHFMSKWTMQGHSCIYTLKPFQWCFGGPSWCLFALSIKALNIPNSCKSATSKMGVHLGVTRAHFLAFSPTCENVFHFRTHFLVFMCSCTPHLVANIMLGLWHMHVFKHKTSRKKKTKFIKINLVKFFRDFEISFFKTTYFLL